MLYDGPVSDSAFDEAVFSAASALSGRDVPAPHALFLLGTGTGVLPGRLENARRLPLSVAGDVPEPWGDTLLHHGIFHGLPVWMMDDEGGAPAADAPPWTAGFPVWLAAAAGASSLIVTAAGASLSGTSDEEPLPVGSLALLRDHVNLSGTSPLVGLGESRLGPLFPDQTTLHDGHLRRVAVSECERLGLSGREAVGACALGPTLETPAERRWFARAGAQVSVQGMGSRLLAAAHAGLGTLAIVVVTHEGDGAVDIAQVASSSRELAPALDDLLWELAGAVERDARAGLERRS